jgi:hypothetical protein
VNTRLLRTTVVVGEVEIIAQADPALRTADELVGEGQRDRPVERIGDQADDEDEQRQQQVVSQVESGRSARPAR